MTFQTSANDLLTPTKYLVDSNSYAGKYTTITSAITAAVADGASATNQKIILIKPGAYTEDLTLADGIVLKGWNTSLSQYNADDTAVQLTGDHSLSSGICWIDHITLLNSGGEALSFSGGTLFIDNCYVEVANAECIELTGATTKYLNIKNTLFNPTGTGTWMSFDGSAATVDISTYNISVIADSTQSIFSGAGGTINWKSKLDSLEHQFSFSNSTLGLSFNFCTFSATADIITTGASTTGIITLDNCVCNAAPPFNIGNVACQTRINGTATSYLGSTFPNNYQYAGTVVGNGTPAERIKAKGRTGYKNAETRTTQGWVQTTDATVTTIWSKTLATGQGVTVKAHISSMKSDYSAYCGGDVIGCARNAGAGAVLVGTTSRVYEDSAGAPLFAIDVNGNDIRLRVTGIAAETWNWASSIQFQLIETNA